MLLVILFYDNLNSESITVAQSMYTTTTCRLYNMFDESTLERVRHVYTVKSTILLYVLSSQRFMKIIINYGNICF